MEHRSRIFNTFVDNLSMDETIAKIDILIQNRIPTQHVVINASKINLMKDDEELTRIVNSCPIINADGHSILWAAKKMNIELNERVTGIDLFIRLLEHGNKKEYKVFLFGATEEVVTKVNQIIKEKYPKVRIVGYRNGYFSETDNVDIVNQIRSSKADIVFVAFSSPMKEYWINQHLDDLEVPFIMGVGGSFDVIAGATKRAPLWMQKNGLEWFYRFIQEPRRMWKRYILGNIKFVMYTYKCKRINRENE